MLLYLAASDLSTVSCGLFAVSRGLPAASCGLFARQIIEVDCVIILHLEADLSSQTPEAENLKVGTMLPMEKLSLTYSSQMSQKNPAGENRKFADKTGYVDLYERLFGGPSWPSPDPESGTMDWNTGRSESNPDPKQWVKILLRITRKNLL